MCGYVKELMNQTQRYRSHSRDRVDLTTRLNAMQSFVDEFFPEKVPAADWTATECSICYSTAYAQVSRLSNCTHEFCRECIDTWDRQSRRPVLSCPMCKRESEIRMSFCVRTRVVQSIQFCIPTPADPHAILDADSDVSETAVSLYESVEEEDTVLVDRSSGEDDDETSDDETSEGEDEDNEDEDEDDDDEEDDAVTTEEESESDDDNVSADARIPAGSTGQRRSPSFQSLPAARRARLS